MNGHFWGGGCFDNGKLGKGGRKQMLYDCVPFTDKISSVVIFINQLLC